MQSFAADFEQHCEGAAAALFGSIRIASPVPVTPVGGLYNQLFSYSYDVTRAGSPLAWTVSTLSPAREYLFRRYSQSSRTWTMMTPGQAYRMTPYVLWTPQVSDVGSHLIEAWERPVGSTRDFERLWRSAPIAIIP